VSERVERAVLVSAAVVAEVVVVVVAARPSHASRSDVLNALRVFE